MLKVGDKIEFTSGLKYEVRAVYDGGFYDLQALQPQFEWMPDFYPVYYSIKIQNYRVI